MNRAAGSTQKENSPDSSKGRDRGLAGIGALDFLPIVCRRDGRHGSRDNCHEKLRSYRFLCRPLSGPQARFGIDQQSGAVHPFQTHHKPRQADSGGVGPPAAGVLKLRYLIRHRKMR
jgi:hypothetical protein